MSRAAKSLDQLVRVARLRADLARRAVAQAGDDLAQAQAERDAAGAAALALARDQAARREVLRGPLLGSPQLRGAIEGLLNTSRADLEREAAAAEATRAAEEAIRHAGARLAEAQAAWRSAEQKHEKRLRLRRPMLQRMAALAELRAEAEAEDRRYGMVP